MKLLLVAHTSGAGGAENALKKLVALLQQGHEVEILFPTREGPAVQYFESLGVACHQLSLGWSLTSIATACLRYAAQDLDGIAQSLKPRGYDLVLTNTLATMHGGLMAAKLGLPHITYVHEYLEHLELRPEDVSPQRYRDMVCSLSHHLLCCSGFTRAQFDPAIAASVLYPHDFSLPSAPELAPTDGAFNLLVIGAHFLRKNVHFSLTVAKALRLRGRAVKLQIIGSANSGSHRLLCQMKLRGNEGVYAHRFQFDPYAPFAATRRITLVCAKAEPFGLTVTESLQRGIPVLASRCGGPEELLSPECLFEVDDLDACVRAVELVMDDYAAAAKRAAERYDELRVAHGSVPAAAVVEQALAAAQADFRSRTEPAGAAFFRDLRCYGNVANIGIDDADIAAHIALVSQESQTPWTGQQVHELILREGKTPGAAVSEDLRRYDVVPFAPSAQMDALYRQGLGLAIELAATWRQAARLQMAAVMVSALLELAQSRSAPLRLLALGDGLGVDALRIAGTGCRVDYLDWEDSAMSRVARLNCELAMRRNSSLNIEFVAAMASDYDAVICLEVLEHVPDVFAMLAQIAAALQTGGLLLVSECFDGIQDFWPTHLHGNERYAAMLPVMAYPCFEMVDVNRTPFGKPYIFRRTAAPADNQQGSQLMDMFIDHPALESMLRSRWRLGYSALPNGVHL